VGESSLIRTLRRDYWTFPWSKGVNFYKASPGLYVMGILNARKFLYDSKKADKLQLSFIAI
jgi:hypothetical protein